jgi:hypothetical protein
MRNIDSRPIRKSGGRRNGEATAEATAFNDVWKSPHDVGSGRRCCSYPDQRFTLRNGIQIIREYAPKKALSNPKLLRVVL